MNNIQAYVIAIAIIAFSVIGWRWVDAQREQIKIRGVQECTEIAAKSGTDKYPFNGAVYSICMDDKGYSTNVK